MGDKTLGKGAVLEELLRAYFLRAGFFVMRGVPFRFAEEDLTDVDLWLYERPTGSARRVQICDIKYKQRPKAVERIFWTSGLAKALKVDGAYVATTDKRTNLRAVADNLDIQLIDGNDIQRMLASHSVMFSYRMTDEELIANLKSVDESLRAKYFLNSRDNILCSLSDGFGARSAVKGLEIFSRLATTAISYRPNSPAAIASGRLAYLASSIVCQSLDFVSVDAAFRPLEERRDLILQAVRYGALASDEGQRSLRLALALIEKYSPAGKSSALAVEQGLKQDLESIPAEIIADQVMKLLKSDQLFLVGKELEMESYNRELNSFDNLSHTSKAMLGALLDYSGVDRKRFATAWASAPQPIDVKSELTASEVQTEAFRKDQ
ncbi:hypothetical protein [Pseudomonas putida]|uniref:hypothetical protein n=1 Tax=Pseudomonas putida TaxID=303 RepID=UPI002364379F|nr:hypothetical protein [Pseudomonas putida]MDD2144697.1 hypothetical protein [Pseudomonas putida]HDS1709069.1 hypothetical protein [Pseudomonas putida]